MAKSPRSNGSPAPFSMWSFAWELGYALALPLVGGVIGGHYLDVKWGTSPWLLLAGLLLGIALSSIFVVKQLGRAMQKINSAGKGEEPPKE